MPRNPPPARKFADVENRWISGDTSDNLQARAMAHLLRTAGDKALPCRELPGLWTSSVPQQQETARLLCEWCPITTQCAYSGVVSPPEYGRRTPA